MAAGRREIEAVRDGRLESLAGLLLSVERFGGVARFEKDGALRTQRRWPLATARSLSEPLQAVRTLSFESQLLWTCEPVATVRCFPGRC